MKKAFLFIALLLLTLRAYAPPPAWWTEPATQIIDDDPNVVVDNYAPANIGQLKNISRKAWEHLNAALEAVGGAKFGKPTWSGTTDNYAPANIGQLKAVAKPFYARLHAVGYDANYYLKQRGYPEGWAFDYPWNNVTPVSPAENYAPANIGQLKMVFSFDLKRDGDGDIMTDWWEHKFGLDPSVANGSGDSDGDGITNVEEYGMQTNPTALDSDGDGFADSSERASKTNPLKKDNPAVSLTAIGFVIP
jgi:hypothetical protein